LLDDEEAAGMPLEEDATEPPLLVVLLEDGASLPAVPPVPPPLCCPQLARASTTRDEPARARLASRFARKAYMIPSSRLKVLEGRPAFRHGFYRPSGAASARVVSAGRAAPRRS